MLLAALQSSTVRLQLTASAPEMSQAAAMSASLVAVKLASQDTLSCAALGLGFGRPTQPTVA